MNDQLTREHEQISDEKYSWEEEYCMKLYTLHQQRLFNIHFIIYAVIMCNVCLLLTGLCNINNMVQKNFNHHGGKFK